MVKFENLVKYLKTVSLLNWLLLAYLGYLLLQLLFYPVDQEYIFKTGFLTVVYFLFRLFPFRYTAILLYVLPVFVVFQIIYGYNRLAYPWQGLPDITGIFNNSGIFGGFVAMGLVTAFGFALSKNRIRQVVFGTLLVPVVIQWIYSQSRAAWLAAIAGIIVLLLPFFRKLTKSNTLVLVSILLLIGIVFSAKIYHFKKDSADGRLLAWTVSWNMLKEKPLTGFGPNGFQKNYLLRQGEYFKSHPDSPWADLADDSTSPFNEFLRVGVEQGMIGLLFVFGILIVVFRSTTTQPIVHAVLVALIVFSCFSYPFEFIAFQVLGIFLLRQAQQTPVIAGLTRNPLKMIFACLLVAVCIFMLFPAYRYYTGVKKWKQTVRTFSPENSQKMAELQALHPVLKDNAWFVFDYGSALYFAGNYSEAIPVLEKSMELFPNAQTLIRLGDSYEQTGGYLQALEAWKKASLIKPSSFTPRYNRAKLYLKMQDYEHAREEATYLLNKKVKINSPKINRMKQEMQAIFQ